MKIPCKFLYCCPCDSFRKYCFRRYVGNSEGTNKPTKGPTIQNFKKRFRGRCRRNFLRRNHRDRTRNQKKVLLESRYCYWNSKEPLHFKIREDLRCKLTSFFFWNIHPLFVRKGTTTQIFLWQTTRDNQSNDRFDLYVGGGLRAWDAHVWLSLRIFQAQPSDSSDPWPINLVYLSGLSSLLYHGPAWVLVAGISPTAGLVSGH